MESPPPCTQLSDCATSPDELQYWVNQGGPQIQQDFKCILEALQPTDGDPFVVVLNSYQQGNPPAPVKGDCAPPQLLGKLRRVEEWINQGALNVQLAFDHLLRSLCQRTERSEQPYSDCLGKYLHKSDIPEAVCADPVGGLSLPMLPIKPSRESELSFLTSTEFDLIVENLAGNPHILGQFGERLAISKEDFYMDKHLQHLEHAKELVTKYQSQPEATREKLIDALRKVGLDFIANTLSPGGNGLK